MAINLARRIIPIADRVLIKRIAPITKTSGGIFLPDTGVTKSNEGEVIAVGPGARGRDGELIPMSVLVGDKVLLPEYGGQPIKSDDDEIFLFRNDDILAKLK